MLGTENSGDARWADLPGRGQEGLHKEDDTFAPTSFNLAMNWGL